ncbi:MAG TPA: glycosyltransferase [Allosphingosinicella sp.]|jgi:GT2 family glycosyltransferase
MRILAAIVTYNRSKLLERCVDHVLAQTRKPDGLIVINNSSTDDTEAMLRRKGVDFITQPNLGGAGGFNRAIAYTVEQGYDAVWLMDDDGFPGSDALGHLADALGQGVACVSSVVLRENDPGNLVFPLPVLDGEGFPAIFAWPRKIGSLAALRRRSSGGLYPFAHLFNGVLVSVEAIRAIGNVETGYFIAGDELDYMMRLRQWGEVLSHVEAHHFHPDVAGRPFSDIKTYFFIKNTIIVNRLYYNRASLRNVLAVGAGLGRVALRNGFAEVASYLFGRRNAALRRAISRGLQGRIGNDFNA